MHNRIYFDIETLPTSNINVIDEISKTIKAPATYKKQESIDAWMAENKDQAIKDAVHKTGLSGLHGQIACIAVAINDEPCTCFSQLNQSESGMIEEFFDHIRSIIGCTFIGHNIAGFDIQFIKHRCIILGVEPPRNMKAAMKAKPWDDCINDTMLMWSSSSQDRISQDKLAKALGMDGKKDMNGAMVADEWKKDPQKVISYCIDDVDQNRQIHKKLTLVL